VKLPESLRTIGSAAWIRSAIFAAIGFLAMALLVDRLGRVAVAKPLAAEKEWSVPAGEELRLSGLGAGPLLSFDTPAGGQLNLTAHNVLIPDAGKAARLDWLPLRNGADADNETSVGIAIAAPGATGTVRLSRAGEVDSPSLRIHSDDATLAVSASSTAGSLLVIPKVAIRADGRMLEPPGPSFTFTVPPQGDVIVETPPSAGGGRRAIEIGDVQPETGDSRLPLREASVAEGRSGACAAPAGSVAWQLLLRLALAPAPTGSDCRGSIGATRVSLGEKALDVTLVGNAFQTADGKPTASLWSLVNANPVLAEGIKKGLPALIGFLFAGLSLRRDAGKQKAKGKGGTRRGRPATTHGAEPPPITKN
jgi:hypothetical protein